MKHPTENSCTQCAQHSHVCKHWQEETIRLEILIVKQKKMSVIKTCAKVYRQKNQIPVYLLITGDTLLSQVIQLSVCLSVCLSQMIFCLLINFAIITSLFFSYLSFSVRRMQEGCIFLFLSTLN